MSLTQKKVLNIEDRKVIKVLEKPFTRQILNIFDKNPLTASEIAEAVSFPKDKIHYHIKKLLSLGLLYITDAEIINQLQENKDKIIDAFNKEEVKEKQRRIKLSLLVDEKIEESLGFTINIPSAYRISKATDDFFWVRKNISNSKTMELMFYEIPLETISKGDSTIVDIVKMRDRVSKTKIPGEDNIYMKVEEAYAPSMFNTIIDNKPTYEVRSVWTMNEYPMAGPFITYLIEDKINNRYLVADGYVYAPSLSKRDLVFELESIIKSIKIK